MSTLGIYVRQRPRVGSELEDGDAKNITLKLSSTELLFNPYDGSKPVSKFATSRAKQSYDQRYKFAGVFDDTDSDKEVYTNVVRARLDAASRGENVLVFAYGATGCGKSYTIGDFHQRISNDLFDQIATLPSSKSVSVRLRYFEIYSEKPYDSLPEAPEKPTYKPTQKTAPKPIGSKRAPLKICSDRMGPRIQGIRDFTVTSAEVMNELINKGNKNRIVAATQANFHSSRSHAVLQIDITQTVVSEQGHIPIRKTSTFTVIDLAGNERAHHTQNSGLRSREGGEINRSSLASGRCLHARAGITPCLPPYRDSCLTRLLQNSLEGHCQASMIICISPCERHFEETRNSLMYGQIASAAPRFKRGPPPGTSRTSPQHPLESRVSELEALVVTLQSKLDQVTIQSNRKSAQLEAERAEHAQTLERERRLRIPLPEDVTASALITKLSNISPRRRFRVT